MTFKFREEQAFWLCKNGAFCAVLCGPADNKISSWNTSMALWLSHIQYMSGVIWNSVLAIVFLLDTCFTSIINLRQLPKIWDENWLTIQSVPSQRHDTMVRRQIWFYIDVEEHNERLAALIVYNRVSPLNAHWVKSIFFPTMQYIWERKRETYCTQ